MSLMNDSTPPAPQGPPPEPGAPATRGGSGGGCLPILLLMAALWFYFEAWEDARQRMERMEAAVHGLQQQVDSLRALVPPSSVAGPARDTATTRGPGDTVQHGAGGP
jgi:hypothetical protein